MSSAVGFNPQSLSPKEIQEIQKQQGQSGTNVGFNVGDQAFSDFESANNKLSTNDGFTYKNSASTTTATAEKSVPYSDAEIASKEKEANAISGQVGSLDSSLNSSQTQTATAMEGNIAAMNSAAESVEGYTADVENSYDNIGNLSSYQETAMNLINNAGVTIEDLNSQIAQFNTEGLAMIAEAGVEGQWATVDEAMAELGELIDPEKMEQIQEKQVEMEQNQQEIDAKTKEMEGLPDDDPKKAELKSEIDGLTAENTTLQAETAELNTIEGQAITMTDLSNLMTNLSEVSAAIGTLNEGIAAQQAVISEQVAVSDNIQAEVDTESKSVASAKSKTESLNTEIENKKKDNDDEANEGITVAQGIQVGAGIGQGVSTAVKTVGEALVASGYGVAAGTVMVTAGKYGEIGFGLIGEGASIYETATNEDLSDSERALAIGESVVGALGTVANLATEIIGDVTDGVSDVKEQAKKFEKPEETKTSG